MKKFTWNEETLSTGYKLIDHQHQFFIKSFNDLVDLIHWEVNDKEPYTTRLRGLFDYLNEHFKSEDEILLAEGSSAYLHHAVEHREFSAHLERTLAAANSVGDVLALLYYLYGWMEIHLEQEAQEFRKLSVLGTATPTQSWPEASRRYHTPPAISH